MTRNISIGTRMAIGFGLFLAILAALACAVFHFQSQSTALQKVYTEHSKPLAEGAQRLESALLRTGIGVRTYLLVPNPERLQQHEDNVRSVRSELHRLEPLPMEADGAALFRNAEPLVERYLGDAARVIEERTREAVSQQSEIQLARTREAALGALASLRELKGRKEERMLRAMEDAADQVKRATALSALAAALCFIVLAWFTAQSIRRPAQQLVRVASAMASGDWKPALAWLPSSGEPPGREPRNEMLSIAHAFGASALALEKREQRLAADAEMAAASGSSLLKEELAGRALKVIAAHVKPEVGVVYWTRTGHSELEPITAFGAGEKLSAIERGEGIPGRAAQEARTVVVGDIPAHSPFNVKLGYDKAPPRSVAAVPITFQGEVRGAVLVASLREIERESIEFLEFAAAQLAVGLANVSAYEDRQRLLERLSESHQRIQAQNEELQAQNEELQAQSEEIQAQNEELQAQSEEIQAQNEQMKDQAEQLRRHAQSLAEADQRKTEFLGLLAHELRNPMAGIANSLHVLNAGAGEYADMAVGVIERQTRQLGRLIDDLLDITRISRGKIELQRGPVDLVEVARECIEDSRAAFQKASLALEADVVQGPLVVDGDRARLCQIICNLLDNAVKFTDPGKRVALSLHERDGEARLSVVDEGVGIAGGVLERLFTPFIQGDPSLARRQGGLGLGLALVKALVEMHGGSVYAHSDGPGAGARFEIRLPLATGSAQAMRDASPRASTAARHTAPPCRVLIIEDNSDAAESLRAALALRGHEVRVACSGLEGLDAARSFQPDVLLCDIGLPVIDGYEVARRFRADERLKAVQLVAVTGYAAAQDCVRAQQAGFDHHFPKPPDMERLSELLARIAISRASASSREAGV